jgi:hypothetical protein
MSYLKPLARKIDEESQAKNEDIKPIPETSSGFHLLQCVQIG